MSERRTSSAKATWDGIFPFDYWQHIARVMSENGLVDGNWPALTLASTFERGVRVGAAVFTGIVAMGEFARRQRT